MLCITLQPNEQAIIGDRIIVTNREGRRINVGIDAPPDVRIRKNQPHGALANVGLRDRIRRRTARVA